MLKDRTSTWNNSKNTVNRLSLLINRTPTIILLVLRLILGILISGAVFKDNCFPAGVAYVGASGGGIFGLAAFLGVSIGYLSFFEIEETILLISAALFTYTIAFLFQYTSISESKWFKTSIVSLILLMINAYSSVNIIRGTVIPTYHQYSEVLLSGILTYLYIASFQDNIRNEAINVKFYSVCAVLATIFMSIPVIEFYIELSVSSIIAHAILMLIICHTNIHVYPITVMFGVAFQFGCVARENSLITYMLYAFSDIFELQRSKLKSILYMMTASASAILFYGVTTPSISQITECMIAAALFILTSKLFTKNQSIIGNAIITDKYTQLYSSAQKLALLMKHISNDIRTDDHVDRLFCDSDLNYVFDCAIDQVCTSCNKKESCWNNPYSESVSLLNCFTDNIMCNGKLSYEDFSEQFKMQCDRTHSLMISINYELRRCFETKRRASEEHAILQLGYKDYYLFSEILNKLASDFSNESVGYSKFENFSAELGIATKRKKGETVCGDCARFFKTQDGILYVILSDGIGCGALARKHSSYVISFLEEMIRLCNDPHLAVSLMNTVLCHHTEQDIGYATIDLLSLDLSCGNCDFYKIGASDSYIFTNGALSIIEGNAKLSGDRSSLCIPQSHFSLTNESMIIMTSDGIEIEREKLLSIIHDSKWKNMKTTAKKMLLCSEDHESDDKTVITLRIQARSDIV